MDLKKVGTLGGPIRMREEVKGLYLGNSESNGPFSKEKLFGVTGPIHPGVPYKQNMALAATQSDTKSGLLAELQEMGLTRDEAVSTVKELLKSGQLVEVFDPDRGEKVLTLRS